MLAAIADFDRNGEEMTLVSYAFQAPGPCAVWMLVIPPGAARKDPTSLSSPVPGSVRPPSRPSRSKLLPGGMLALTQGDGTPEVGAEYCMSHTGDSRLQEMIGCRYCVKHVAYAIGYCSCLIRHYWLHLVSSND